MVGQNAGATDAGAISESITKESIGGGNVSPDSLKESLSFSELIAESTQLPTVVVDPSFAHLNGRRTSRANVTRSTIRERVAIVNVTVPANYAYITGGMKIDFTKVGTIDRFTQVYLCSPTHFSKPFYVNFVPDTNNSASLGKIKFYDATGTELANGSLVLQNVTFKAYIRGV